VNEFGNWLIFRKVINMRGCLVFLTYSISVDGVCYRKKSSLPPSASSAEKGYMKNPMVKFKIADDDDDDGAEAETRPLTTDCSGAHTDAVGADTSRV